MKYTVDVDIKLTPEQIASEFCDIDEHEQAEVFNHIALLSSQWNRDFCFQLQAVICSHKLTEEGKQIMRKIGEYGE